MSMNSLSLNRFTPPQQARLNPQVAQQRQGVNLKAEKYLNSNKRALTELFDHLANSPYISKENVDEYREAVMRGLQQLEEHQDTLDGVLCYDKCASSMGGPQFLITLINRLDPAAAPEPTPSAVYLSNAVGGLLETLNEFFVRVLQEAGNKKAVADFFQN